MKHKMNSGYTKYQHDKNHSHNHGSEPNIQLLLYDENMIQVSIKGTAENDIYMVSCIDGYWRCDCVDWQIQFGKIKENPELGCYCCKHIEEAHYFIADIKLSGQTKLKG